MVHYRFESEWILTADIEAVFELLVRSDDFSVWWPSVRKSRLIEEGEPNGVGRRAGYSLKSPLLYSMRFETKTIEVDRPRRIHGLIRGDLVGTGTYLLERVDQGTRVGFSWHVATARTWMNWVAPAAKPLFVWAHHRLMQEGCKAMARHMGARLVSTKTHLMGSRA